VRGYFKFRANITPHRVRNARSSRKLELRAVSVSFRIGAFEKNRLRSRVAIKDASNELRTVLLRWQIAYKKENFFRGIRILLEALRIGLFSEKRG
jgi:hypothetical protein